MTPWIALLVALGSSTATLATLPVEAGSQPSASRSEVATELLSPIRALVRPLSMPRTWLWLDQSSRFGRFEEEVAATRALLDVVPEWADGHAHLAWLLGLDLRRNEDDPRRRADYLFAAIQTLERETDRCLQRSDEVDAVSLCLSAATLLLHTADVDADLAPIYLERYGLRIEDHARQIAARAVEISSDEVTRGRLADASTASLRAALRRGQLERAEAMREGALELFRSVDAPSARRLADTLEELGPLPEALREAQNDDSRLRRLAEDAPWIRSAIDSVLEIAAERLPESNEEGR